MTHSCMSWINSFGQVSGPPPDGEGIGNQGRGQDRSSDRARIRTPRRGRQNLPDLKVREAECDQLRRNHRQNVPR